MTNTQPMTFAMHAQQDVENIANALDDLAARLRLRAREFTSTSPQRARPSWITARLVNEYTQGLGSNSCHLQSLLCDAYHADREYDQDTMGAQS